jgi:hypothetical protein
MIALLPYLKKADDNTAIKTILGITEPACTITNGSSVFTNNINALVKTLQKISIKGFNNTPSGSTIKSIVEENKFNASFEAIISDPCLMAHNHNMNVWDWIVTGGDSTNPGGSLQDYLKNIKKIEVLSNEIRVISKKSLIYDLLILQYYSSYNFRKALDDYTAAAASLKPTKIMFFLDQTETSLNEEYWNGILLKDRTSTNVPETFSYYGMILHVLHEQVKTKNISAIPKEYTEAYAQYSSNIVEKFHIKALSNIGESGSLASKTIDESDPKNHINFIQPFSSEHVKTATALNNIDFYNDQNLFANDSFLKTPANGYVAQLAATSPLSNNPFPGLPPLFHVPDNQFILFFEETPDSYQIHFYSDPNTANKAMEKDQLEWGVRLKFNKDTPAIAGNISKTHQTVNGITLEKYTGGSVTNGTDNVFNHTVGPSSDGMAILVTVPSNIIDIATNAGVRNVSNDSFKMKASSDNGGLINSLTFLKNSHDRYLMSKLCTTQKCNELSKYIRHNTRRLYDETIDKPLLAKLVDQDKLTGTYTAITPPPAPLTPTPNNTGLHIMIQTYLTDINTQTGLTNVYKLYGGVNACLASDTTTNKRLYVFNKSKALATLNAPFEVDIISYNNLESPELAQTPAGGGATTIVGTGDATVGAGFSGKIFLLRNCVRAIRDWYTKVAKGT